MNGSHRDGKVVHLPHSVKAPVADCEAQFKLMQREAAQYVAEMILQLAQLARTARLREGEASLEATYQMFCKAAENSPLSGVILVDRKGWRRQGQAQDGAP